MNRCEGFAEKLWLLHVKWVSEGRSCAFWRMVAHVEMQSVLMHRKWNAMSIDAQPHFRLFNLKENSKKILFASWVLGKAQSAQTTFRCLNLSLNFNWLLGKNYFFTKCLISSLKIRRLKMPCIKKNACCLFCKHLRTFKSNKNMD